MLVSLVRIWIAIFRALLCRTLSNSLLNKDKASTEGLNRKSNAQPKMVSGRKPYNHTKCDISNMSCLQNQHLKNANIMIPIPYGRDLPCDDDYL